MGHEYTEQIQLFRTSIRLYTYLKHKSWHQICTFLMSSRYLPLMASRLFADIRKYTCPCPHLSNQNVDKRTFADLTNLTWTPDFFNSFYCIGVHARLARSARIFFGKGTRSSWNQFVLKMDFAGNIYNTRTRNK